MIALVPLASSLFLVIAAALVARTHESIRARHRAILALGMVLGLGIIALALALALASSGHDLLLSLGSVELFLVPSEFFAAAALVVSLVGFLAVALSPVASHGPGTMARILCLIALALACMAIHHHLALGVVWALAPAVVWLDLRSRRETRATARVFAIYQVPSVLLVALGLILIAMQRADLAIYPLLVGVALRQAVIPLHSWLPELVERAPMGIVVAFVAPQLGVYAHLDVIAGHLPAGLAHGVATVGVITAILAAAMGVVQRDARRALAYLLMSQGGLVVLGVASPALIGLRGALLAWQVVAVATSGFAMTIAALEARRGDLSLDHPGGSFARTPRMAIAFLVLGFASVGMPLTLGFVAEDLLVQGSLAESPAFGLALIIAMGVNGMTVMRAFFALFSGTRKHTGETDLTVREICGVTLALAALLIGGIWPREVVSLRLDRPAATQTHSTAAQLPSTANHSLQSTG